MFAPLLTAVVVHFLFFLKLIPTSLLTTKRYQLGGDRQRSLFRVLRSLSVQFAHIGYTASLGYLCAFFLLFMDAQHAFFCVHELLIQYGLDQMYTDGIPKAMVVLEVTQSIVQKYLPHLAAHLEHRGVYVHMFAMDWLLSMFARQPAIAVRLMDHFLHFGTFEFFYRLVLALLRLSSSVLLLENDFSKLMGLLVSLPSSFDADGEDAVERLMECAMTQKLPSVSALSGMEREAATSLFNQEEEKVKEKEKERRDINQLEQKEVLSSIVTKVESSTDGSVDNSVDDEEGEEVMVEEKEKEEMSGLE